MYLECVINILTHLSPAVDIDAFAGNKGKYLYYLQRENVPVPSWIIIGADVFQQFRINSGLDAKISPLLADFDGENASTIAADIQRFIVTETSTTSLQTLVEKALNLIGDVPLAVRSSGVEEDSDQFSFAGQFDTFLGITGRDSVTEHIKKCWASCYSERALLYRYKQELSFDNIEIAVVLQHLIPADVSGVTFTANPSNGNPNEMVISAVYGLGEGLVSGAIDADTLILSKKKAQVLQTTIGEKSQRFDAEGIFDVNQEQQQKLALDPTQIKTLHQQCMQLEVLFKTPQDIEWCIQDEQVWILQTRPITVPIWPEGEVQIWDNSNVVENYPGITSPLTFTLTQHLYANVFKEYCRLLGIPRRYLSQMDDFLKQVLAYLNGRVYYNLLHWYRLAGINPLQNLGRKMMEVQMGVDQSLDLKDFSHRIAPYQPRNKYEGYLIRFVTGIKFIGFFVNLTRLVKKFTKDFYPQYNHYNAIDYKNLSPNEVFTHYKNYEKIVIGQWGHTIALESSIGLSYGILRMLIKRWIPAAPEWFEVAVIGGIDNMESLQPAHEMMRLAQQVKSSSVLTELIQNTPSNEIYAHLQRDHTAFLVHIDDYITDYGYRSNNELKLEEPDLRQDPSVLFDMLKSALVVSDALPNSKAAAENEQQVDAILDKALNGMQRIVFNAVRKRVRNAIQNRETVRFCRSRIFGVFRNMFLSMGKGLAELQVIEQQHDIFYLRLEEIKGCFEGTLSHREIKPLIAQRHQDMQAYKKMDALPSRFVTQGPVGYWLDTFGQTLGQIEDTLSDGELRGISCSPGMAEGIAAVVEEPSDFKQGVLVTYRTDPGWVAVFPSAEALLIERGSPLTHAAIVAREIGIPTIVQIPHLTKHIKTGMKLKIDGAKGNIVIQDIPEVINA